MKCVVCGGIRLKDKFKDLGIVSCAACGHIFYNIKEEAFKAVDIYREDYFINGEYGNYLADRPVITRNFLNRKREILRYCAGGRLLEIGSAYGFFLDCVRDKFTATGFEVSAEAASYARQELALDVRTDDFLRSPIDGNFDAACLFDTIEHLARPDTYLEKIAALLKCGGYLFITTGDISAFVPRVMGRRWRLMHPPSHIHYFSRDTIKRLCVSKGFGPVSIRYIPVWRSIHQIAGSVFGVKKLEKMAPVGIPVNTFDIMTIVAKKA